MIFSGCFHLLECKFNDNTSLFYSWTYLQVSRIMLAHTRCTMNTYWIALLSKPVREEATICVPLAPVNSVTPASSSAWLDFSFLIYKTRTLSSCILLLIFIAAYIGTRLNALHGKQSVHMNYYTGYRSAMKRLPSVDNSQFLRQRREKESQTYWPLFVIHSQITVFYIPQTRATEVKSISTSPALLPLQCWRGRRASVCSPLPSPPLLTLAIFFFPFLSECIR